MNTLNTAIVTALLAMGLAGNAMAAPNHHDSNRGHQSAKKVVVKKHAAKHVVVKRAAPKAVKRVVVKKAAPKRVVKRVVKRIVKKAPQRVAKTYRVRPGDTLSRISARTHIPLHKLVRLNKLWGNKANNLRVGMRIRLA